MIFKHIFLVTVLNEPEFIFSTQLNGFKYYFVTVTISHQSFAPTKIDIDDMKEICWSVVSFINE